jgi:CRP-like cAMP-binding protein
MSVGGKIERLKAVPFFAQSSTDELTLVASLAEEMDVPAGKVLVEEGQVAKAFYVVAQGTATAVKKGRTLATIGPGSFFGELSMLDREPRTATVTAETPMRLFMIDPKSFEALLKNSPTFSRRLLEGLAERLRKADELLTTGADEG